MNGYSVLYDHIEDPPCFEIQYNNALCSPTLYRYSDNFNHWTWISKNIDTVEVTSEEYLHCRGYVDFFPITHTLTHTHQCFLKRLCLLKRKEKFENHVLGGWIYVNLKWGAVQFLGGLDSSLWSWNGGGFFPKS